MRNPFGAWLGLLTVMALGGLACGAGQGVPTAVLQTVEVTRLVVVTQEVPVTVVVTEAADPAGAATQDLATAPFEYGSLTGTYGWLTAVKGSGCRVAVVHRILFTSGHVLEFELGCNRGAPSFNLGYAYGLVPMVDDRAVFVMPDIGVGQTCSLSFDFTALEGLEVVQDGSDAACGFGSGINASGLYGRIDPEIPIIGCLNPETGCP